MKLIFYTAIHFLVDFTCIYRMCGIVMPQSESYEYWIVLVILYNFLAFALPALIGAIADVLDLGESLAAAGCIMLSLSALFHSNVLFLVMLQGIGNGFFHVGAGRNILKQSINKYAPAGIFISSGALGVFLGTQWSPLLINFLPCLLALLFGAIGIFMFITGRKKGDRKAEEYVHNESLGESKKEKQRSSLFAVAIIMILLVVTIRSFYGTAVSYSWNNCFEIGLVFTICIAGGKAAGGILADKINVKFTTVISLGGAALTVLFSENSMIFGCISIFLFNMTMPVTLGLIAEAWKNFPGFAFGILMLALFAGTLPDLFGNGIKLSMTDLCLISAVSLIFLLIAVFSLEKERTAG